jgi:hypothetical protein
MKALRESEMETTSLGGKLVWFIGLWIGGVVTIGALSLLLRAILLP